MVGLVKVGDRPETLNNWAHVLLQKINEAIGLESLHFAFPNLLPGHIDRFVLVASCSVLHVTSGVTVSDRLPFTFAVVFGDLGVSDF